jgi:hypothetical protein
MFGERDSNWESKAKAKNELKKSKGRFSQTITGLSNETYDSNRRSATRDEKAASSLPLHSVHQ